MKKNILQWTSELALLIKQELCSDDETIRQQAQNKLLEEGLTDNIVAIQLAHDSKNLASSPYADLIVETIMQLPLETRFRALVLMAEADHPYHEIGQKELIDAIKIFKENKDIEKLLKIKKSYVPRDILELAFQALLELGENPPPLRPDPRHDLSVESMEDVTIENDWVRCNVSIDRSAKVFTANFSIEAGIIQKVKVTCEAESDYEANRNYISSQGFEQTSMRNDGEFLYYWYERSLQNRGQATDTADDEIQQLVKNLRKDASHQDERIESALKLGELLEDEELITVAKNLKPISKAQAGSVSLDKQWRNDGKLWAILDQALENKGYPPATTLKENMVWYSRSSGEQVARWFGEDAAEHARQIIETSKTAKQKCAEILGTLGKPSDVPLLVNVLTDDKDNVRASAVLALGNIGTPEAFQTIIQHSEGEQVGSLTMRGIATALGGSDDPASILVLTRLLETDPLSAKNAGMSLIKLGHSDAVIQVMENHDNKYFQTLAAQALAESSSDTPNDK